MMNNTLIINKPQEYSNIQMSLQYIILSGYVIMSWGTYNFVSISTKLMLMYLYLYN